ncbi:DUF397 domain-containing protein [Actinocorallia longicatena]|uniref:DUF397 domain-containing protein n=1 Tax=Actinocorallia longicatena TaxID=111803 RepID=A0ABP6QEE1_9ACTN
MLEYSRLSWRKSSRSAQNGACVEVGSGPSARDHVALRDSKNPDGAKLVFARPEFRSFVDRVKSL